MHNFQQVSLLLNSTLGNNLIVSKLLTFHLVCHLHLLLLLCIELLQQEYLLTVGFACEELSFILNIEFHCIRIVEIDASVRLTVEFLLS